MQGGKLDLYKTARTMKSARAIMLEALDKEIQEEFCLSKEDMSFEVAYSSEDSTMAELAKTAIIEKFGIEDVMMEPLTLSLSTYIGLEIGRAHV